MKKVSLFLLIILLAGSLLLLRNRQIRTFSGGKLKITTSIYPMAFFASYIGGDKVEVINITPAGAEPHDYNLTPQDILNVTESKLLILNGVIEPWGDRIKSNVDNKKVQVMIAGDGLMTQIIEEEGQNTLDPHVWLLPQLAKVEVQKIASAIEFMDPANTNYYENNERDLEAKLNKIDLDYKTGLYNCQTRNFVTSHAAFGYLAKYYSLNQIAIAGLTPDAEPSLERLAQVADVVKKERIKYIFFEALVSPKLSETIAQETGAKTSVLDPIEGITAENHAKGNDYLTLMETNLQNLKKALSCK